MKEKENLPEKKQYGFGTKVLVVLFVLVGLAIAYFSSQAKPKENIANSVPVENIFVDVNGDGNVDLIVSGNVVYNKGQGDFLVSQPNQ
jgi:hypothetical protein